MVIVDRPAPQDRAPVLRRPFTPADLGFGGHPWPQCFAGRAAVAVPQSPERPVLTHDGWTADAHSLALDLRWSGQLAAGRLTVHSPGGARWLDCNLPLTREWRRAANAHEGVVLMAGPFADISEFRNAAAAGALSLLAVPVSIIGGSW
ncbi:hypothetical protein ACFWNL_38935 [Kitasatospora sp. NPDC058397]|uniref:hypothetical protein n=1 Tax=unclassified Kitasatospora TaxID=2633591 RepID=UPI00364F5876